MPRILVVDDEPFFREGLRVLLPARLGRNDLIIDEAADGETACYLLSTQSYSVIISDESLTSLRGSDVLKRLRRGELLATPQATAPDTFFLIVTGNGHAAEIEQSVDGCACEVTFKPMELTHFVALIAPRLPR